METIDIIRIIGNWSNGKGPLYRQLAQAFVKAIAAGDIIAGTQLPPERQLASALAISRSTIVGAYELLRQEEWVESRRGSGTTISLQSPHKLNLIRGNVKSTLAHSPFFDSLFDSTKTTIDFSAGNPGNLEILPSTAFTLSQEVLTRLLKDRGYTALGLIELRKTIAERYTQRGIKTNLNQILITSGAQQAISLIAACYLQRGDKVITENPTYFGAIDAFRANGARLVGIKVEADHGIKLETLRAQIEASLPGLIYLQPNYQNPTGVVYPLNARREIAKLATEYNVPIVEDDTLGEIELEGQTPPLIAAFTEDENILSIGSMSKLFWSGLRIGWIRSSEAIIGKLSRVKVVSDLGTSVINQTIAVRILADIEKVKVARKNELQPKLEQITRLLSEMLPQWKWVRPPGGLFLWVKIPTGNAITFAQVAYRYGVIILPGNTMSTDESFIEYIRLPFLLDTPELVEGIKRLAQAWEAYLLLLEKPDKDQTSERIIV